MKKVLEYIKAKPRLIFLVSGLVVQILEQAGIKIDSEILETVLDLATLIALGQVMKKSDADKIV